MDAVFGYQPVPGVWDEMMAEDGSIRPHWRWFHGQLCQWGKNGIQENAARIAQLLKDHGVTYNAYQDAGAAGRPWFLDVIPVLIRAEDFAHVENGLRQRIRLFRAMLADIYGSQRIIRESWVPAQLLYANPGYLRQVADVPIEGESLTTLATDWIRNPDGSWMALADRCQMPGGIGYALENRIVLAQPFSQEFQQCRIQRLAGFFEHEREMFREMAPLHRHTPNVVMLTPGPRHRNYFEHAFKARYLGFPLVEGADLTVRDRRLFMKTLEGLRQVDVLIRRLEDGDCDTLELDPSSVSGVPGLLEAWRAGRVKMANRIGSGVLEAAAWLPYLPRLCQELLGEELLIPSVPTHWCGDRDILAKLNHDPRRWVLKKAYADDVRPAVSLSQFDPSALDELLREVNADPESWVIQQPMALSHAPAWTGDRLEPRAFVWRSFVCADEHQSHVMPGGLGRISPGPEGFLVSMMAGALSKDVWVISDQEVVAKSLLTERVDGLRVSRPPRDVPSRIADHLFWLGRYTERMEQTTRLLRMLGKRLGGEGGEMQMQELRDGLRLAGELELLEKNFPMHADFVMIQQTISSWMQDARHRDGLADLMTKIHFNAAAARDRLSDDTWRLFRWLQDELDAPLMDHAAYGITSKLDRIVLVLAAFSGMQSENMVRGHGWRFLEMGRRIERGYACAGYLHAAIALCETHEAVLVPLLEVFDSTMTYRRHHYATPKLLPVVDLLMLHAANPRSLAFQLEAMAQQASLLPPGSSLTGADHAKTAIARMLSRLELVDLSSPAEPPDVLHGLRQICDSTKEDLEHFSNQLTEDYFSHAIRRSR
jgi:uncharacterized circularly permuted ATP-grasp superfamily protein/uncharacterized alpha-E superfamily protein